MQRVFQTLSVEIRHGVQRITIDRPATHNAFNEVVIGELLSAFKMPPSPDVKVTILSGEGTTFSAGADLNWMKKMAEFSREENLRDSYRLFEMINAIYSHPLPVIARVNGNAFGGGAGLIAACDMAFGVDNASFGFRECRLGLLPAVISPFVMNKIGRTHCTRYFLTAEIFRAAEAVRIGLLQQAYPSLEEVDAEIDRIVKEIAQNSTDAVMECKRLIRDVHGRHNDPTAVRDTVCKAIASIRCSPSGQEGVRSFLEKRQPRWSQLAASHA